MTNEEWGDIKFFKPSEFNNPDKMDYALLTLIDLIRIDSNEPMIITSSYREDDPLAHGKGLAVDIRCHESMKRLNIIRAAMKHNVRRIGIYDKHIHIDVDYSLPQDVMWVGESE